MGFDTSKDGRILLINMFGILRGIWVEGNRGIFSSSYFLLHLLRDRMKFLASLAKFGYEGFTSFVFNHFLTGKFSCTFVNCNLYSSV